MSDLRPLRDVSFRHLAVALSINEFGNAIGEVALALLVYSQTGSAVASATLFLALRFFPALLAPLLTTYVEVLHPRVVLTVLYIAEAALFAAIASVAHRFSLALVLVLVTADGVLAIVATTLNRSAITNNLVAVGLLREGNGIVNLGAMIAFAAGPVVAGALVASNGARLALLIDAGTFLVTAVAIATAPGLRIESDHETGTAGRFKAGMAILRTRPALRRLLIAITITLGLTSVAVPIEVVFAQKTLHAGGSGYGLMLTAWGTGMMLGGGAFTVAHRFSLMRILGYSTALIAIGYGGLALSPTLAFACIFSFVGGAGNGAAWVAAMTAIQERIPLTNQSAVMSVLYALNQVMPAIGFVIGGVVTSMTSPRVAYAISAIGTAIAISAFFFRPVDRARLSQPHDRPTAGDGGANQDDPSPAGDSQEIAVSGRTFTSPTPFIG